MKESNEINKQMNEHDREQERISEIVMNNRNNEQKSCPLKIKKSPLKTDVSNYSSVRLQ